MAYSWVNPAMQPISVAHTKDIVLLDAGLVLSLEGVEMPWSRLHAFFEACYMAGSRAPFLEVGGSCTQRAMACAHNSEQFACAKGEQVADTPHCTPLFRQYRWWRSWSGLGWMWTP